MRDMRLPATACPDGRCLKRLLMSRTSTEEPHLEETQPEWLVLLVVGPLRLPTSKEEPPPFPLSCSLAAL